MKKINGFYSRVSALGQNSDRQLKELENYDLHIEDKCSGSIPFFEREGGKKIFNLIEKGDLKSLSVHQIDRLGRDLKDILNSISIFNSKKINIHFVQQGLKTLNEDGTENIISKMIISILGVVAEMEHKLIRERQKEGIHIAKAKGVYKGRKKGTTLNNFDFLDKPKVRKALQYLNQGLKNTEIAKLAGLHPNTITKIKKIKRLIE